MAYITRADIELLIGVNNVAEYADLNNDNDADEITAAVAGAISAAEDEFDDRLRHGKYLIPLSSVNDNTKRIIAALAARNLFNPRRGGDENAQISNLDKWALRQIDAIAKGVMKLDATLGFQGPTAPVAIT